MKYPDYNFTAKHFYALPHTDLETDSYSLRIGKIPSEGLLKSEGLNQLWELGLPLEDLFKIPIDMRNRNSKTKTPASKPNPE